MSDLLFLLNALFFSFLKLYRLRDPVAGGNLRSVCLSVCVFTISLCPTCCSCSTRCSSRSSSCTGSGIRWLVVTSGLSVCLSVCSLSHCVRPVVPAQRAVLLVPQAVQAQGSGGWWEPQVCLFVCLCVHDLTVSNLLFLLNVLFFSFLKLYRLRDPVAGGNLRSVCLSVCLFVCLCVHYLTVSDLLFLLNALFFSFLKLYRLRDPVAGGNLRSVCLSVCLCVHYLTVSDLLFLLNALFFSFLKLYRLRDPVAGGNLRSVCLFVHYDTVRGEQIRLSHPSFLSLGRSACLCLLPPSLYLLSLYDSPSLSLSLPPSPKYTHSKAV